MSTGDVGALLTDTVTTEVTEQTISAAEAEDTEDLSKLAWPDFLVIAIYFVCVLAVGLWSSRKSQSSVSGYFLASRNIGWIPVGASLFASNIGSGHFIGLAGAGAASGIAVHGFEQASVYALLLLGWVFVPVYMSSEVYTMPEYLRLRLGGQRIRVYLSCLSLLLYIFTKISVDLYSGALFIQASLNKSSSEWLYISILLLLVVAAVFTITGGLTAVVWTDLLQTVLMIIGAFILMGIAFNAVGGYNELVESFPYAIASVVATDALNNTCGSPPSDYLHLFRTTEVGKSDYPWTGMTFGLSILEIYYWCTEQVIVQRTLASKNMIHAKGGCILASFIKFLPLWLMIFPGMAARILYPDRVGCASPETCMAVCGNDKGCTSTAYVELLVTLLPTGLRGLMLAVMMAALMSSLTSVFNSASTIFTMDIWTMLKKHCSRSQNKPSERELLIIGRVFVAVLVVVSVVWVPVIQSTGNSRLFDYINTIFSFLASPISAIYVLAVLWPRLTEQGAFWALMVGLAIGVIRFIMEFSYTIPPCGSSQPDPRPEFIKAVVGHYLHFAVYSWVITMVVAVSLSILTEPIPAECLYRLTFWSRHDPRVRRPIKTSHREKDGGNKEKDFHLKEKKETGGSASSEETEDATSAEPKMAVSYKHLQAETSSSGNTAIDSTNEINACQSITKTTESPPAQSAHSAKQRAEEAAKFLYEPPFWKNVVNISAIICTILCTFIFGFYA